MRGGGENEGREKEERGTEDNEKDGRGKEWKGRGEGWLLKELRDERVNETNR